MLLWFCLLLSLGFAIWSFWYARRCASDLDDAIRYIWVLRGRVADARGERLNAQIQAQHDTALLKRDLIFAAATIFVERENKSRLRVRIWQLEEELEQLRGRQHGITVHRPERKIRDVAGN